MTVLHSAPPERLSAFSVGVFAVLIQCWFWNCGHQSFSPLKRSCCSGLRG
jgi:hypothetical protein